MAILKFSYYPRLYFNPVSKKQIEVYRPYVPIRLAFAHHLDKDVVYCLVDSGSDRNLFPALWGKSLGINITKGVPVNVTGIGGHDLVAYKHNVKIYLDTFGLETEVFFTDRQKMPLLGRNGFFDKFKRVCFNETEKYLEIEK